MQYFSICNGLKGARPAGSLNAVQRWSEQRKIEIHAPEYLGNIVRADHHRDGTARVQRVDADEKATSGS